MFGTIALIGIATAFNFINIIIKWRKDRRADAIFDLTISALMAAIFAGSMAGMAIAMVSSFFFSLYLWIYPIRMPRMTINPRLAKYALLALIAIIIFIANYFAIGLIIKL